MIYICLAKRCHFLFIGDASIQTCPDCGKKSIRAATAAERMEFFRRQTELMHTERRSG